MITSNFEPMKKMQIIPGLFDTVFFPVFPVRAGKTGVSENSADAAPSFKPQLAPGAAKCISARKLARHDNSDLPVSLEDWLACKAALEICRKGRQGTEDISRA
jgi:hypothetical protein